MENYETFQSEKDLLQGNIARICVSNDTTEIDSMRTYALKRINKIADYRISELSQKKATAIATFFKPSGKYYTEETYEFENTDDEPWVIFDQVKERFKNAYKGMHMSVTFDSNYGKGYPFMEPADKRE